MKNTLAISLRAAAAVFMSIACSDASLVEKGHLMQLAGLMMERPDKVNPDDFEALPGGADVYATITLAIKRSQSARAAAARRAARLHVERPECDVDQSASHEESEQDISSQSAGVEPSLSTVAESAARPSRHPRLKVRCRYVMPESRGRRYGRKAPIAVRKNSAVKSQSSKTDT